MAGREVLICLGVGLPVAGVCAFKPVHVGGAILGADCGPAIAAVHVRSGGGVFDDALAADCHRAAAPWVLLAVGAALLAGVLALVLGLAVKRRPPQVVYVPYVPPPGATPSG